LEFSKSFYKDEQKAWERSQALADKLNARIQDLNRVGSRHQNKGPDFGPYVMELQCRIRRNWQPPRANHNKRIVANFRIGRDGSLLSLNIQQSSGSPDADQAALNAVRASAPFRALPSNYRGHDITAQFTFDYEITKRHKK
jgi:TonB family protein